MARVEMFTWQPETCRDCDRVGLESWECFDAGHGAEPPGLYFNLNDDVVDIVRLDGQLDYRYALLEIAAVARELAGSK